MEYFSQIGQDQYYIEHIINGKKGGRFLDVGAHDGIRTSNTYALEKYLGWTGICIEANAALAKECEQNRPASRVIQAAVWSEEKTVVFEYPHSGNDFLSRIGGLAVNENYFAGDFTSTIDVEMVAKPLTALIGTGNQHFDYFSLDIEGAELEALKGIDWDNTSFGYIAIEYGHRESFKQEIQAFMQAHGYSLHRINDFDIDFIPS
jgi:FkbM family methyltransferase